MGAQRPTVTPGHQSPTWLPRVQRSFFFLALAAKQKRKHCSPSWQTPQKVTDITAAFLSLPLSFFFLLLFFWRFRDAAARVTHGMRIKWTFVFQNISWGLFLCVSRVCLWDLSSSSRSTTHKITRRDHISLFSLLCKLLLFFFNPPLSTSAHLVRHNDWKSQRGCFGAECQSSSNTLETT